MEGWQTRCFEECIESVVYTTKIQRKDFLTEGEYPIVSQEDGLINGFWDSDTDLFRIDRPVVIFGDHTRALKYIDFDFVLGADGVKILKPKPFLHSRYFYYQLQTAQLNSLGYARHYRLLKEHKVLYPNYAEQRRIVAILDEAFDAIATAKANTEKSLQNAREVFASQSELRFEQSGSWERVQLADLIDRGWIVSHLDGNHGSDYPRKEEFVESGVPYIASSAVKGNAVDFTEAKYLTPKRAASIRKGLAKNRDVLFAHNATVGPVAILETNEEIVILGTSLTYYRCDPRCINPEYLAHFMRSPAFTSQYQQVMKQSTRNQVPITKQREFFHVIPPLEIQIKIAEALESSSFEIERLSGVYKHKLAALDELKKSLLHQAFTGKLTAKTTDKQLEAVA